MPKERKRAYEEDEGTIQRGVNQRNKPNGQKRAQGNKTIGDNFCQKLSFEEQFTTNMENSKVSNRSHHVYPKAAHGLSKYQ